MMLRYIFIISIPLFIALATAEELYRYIDDQGNEYVVDSPYKLPLSVKERERYIKEYEKKKKEERQLPPDLQDNRPAYKDTIRRIEPDNTHTEEEGTTKKRLLTEENKRKIEELTKRLEDTVKELGYKSQRALITQIPSLKEEVERLKAKVEEIKKELNEYYEQADKIERP